MSFEMVLDFSPVKPDVSEDIRMLAILQKKVRELYATAQNNKTIEKGFLTFVQPLLETRYVWEHFSDALLDENNQWNTDARLVAAEMTEACVHSLRCYTDLTEWRFLHVKVYAQRITKRLAKEDIQSAMPGYYANVFPLYEKIENAIVALKNVPEQKIYKRVELLDQVNNDCDIILAALNESALNELKRKSAAHLVFSAFKYIGAAAVGTLITWLIQRLLLA